jgi:oxygen-independent coproporphyrinogen III oxidase
MQSNSSTELIRKYNVAGPRYTSYPTVPYWDPQSFSTEKWKLNVRNAYSEYGEGEGISLYIHLPFCESLCTYCGCNTRITVNHAVEIPYIKAVLQEWEIYKSILNTENITIKEIHLGGGTPTFFSPDNLKFLITEILKNTTVKSYDDFSFEGHPANTTREHLEVLYSCGFRRMSLGIQDFDPEVQEIINRKQSFEQVAEVTSIARAIGYTSVNYDLIYGLPKQKLSGLVETIKQVKLLRPDRIAFYSYAHVPWLKPGQRKFTEADLPEDDAKRNLYETGRLMLEDAGYYEIGMDHFSLPSDSLFQAYKSKKLHRNFMGYTSSASHMIIGLGCSSISDTWTAFAQNTKTVEQYISIVNSGELPVFRGHVLNAEDLILRQHILNLMCRLETSWKEDSMYFDSISFCVERLYNLYEDGLIEFGEDSVYITEKGKPFIRNCCFAFDERMNRKISDTQIFSKTI